MVKLVPGGAISNVGDTVSSAPSFLCSLGSGLPVRSPGFQPIDIRKLAGAGGSSRSAAPRAPSLV